MNIFRYVSWVKIIAIFGMVIPCIMTLVKGGRFATIAGCYLAFPFIFTLIWVYKSIIRVKKAIIAATIPDWVAVKEFLNVSSMPLFPSIERHPVVVFLNEVCANLNRNNSSDHGEFVRYLEFHASGRPCLSRDGSKVLLAKMERSSIYAKVEGAFSWLQLNSALVFKFMWLGLATIVLVTVFELIWQTIKK